MKPRRRTLLIEMDFPADVDLATVKSYASDALRCWGGGFFPGDAEQDPDPLFYTTSAPTRRMRLKDEAK